MYSLQGREAMRITLEVIGARGGFTRRVLTSAPMPKEKIASSSIRSSGQDVGSSASKTAKAITIGAGAGLLGSLVGMGGGLVAIPALTGWLRLTQHQAHGTSLGAVFATGAAGSAAYALSGHVDYRAASAMTIGGMVGARFGARATAGISPSALKLALGVLMIVVAPLLPLRDNFRKHMALLFTEDSPDGASKLDSSSVLKMENNDQAHPLGRPEATTVVAKSSDRESTPPVDGHVKEHDGDDTKEDIIAARVFKVLRMSAIGLGSGFLAGVFGVGGGVVTVPALSLATDLSHKEVLGTSLAAMVLPAMVGSATHLKQGNLLGRIAIPLAVGTGVGAFVGGNYAARHLNDTTLKWAFSGLMLVLGGRTIAGARAAAVATKAVKLK